MGNDKDKLEYAPFNNSGWYGPSPKKVALQNEVDTQNKMGIPQNEIGTPQNETGMGGGDNTIGQMMLMMNILGNTPKNNTKDEITSDKKNRIVFPDGVSIPIDNIDEDSIKYLQTKFYRYIYNRDYEGLKEIKVLDEKQDYTNIIESLKKTLCDNQFKMTQKLLVKIVNDYLRDFLNIIGFKYAIDFPVMAGSVSDIEKTGKHESPMVESSQQESQEEEHKPKGEALIPTLCGLFHKGKKILFYGDNLTGKTVMATDVAARDFFKNPILFFIDGKKDDQKYLKILGNKGSIIFSQQVESKRQEIEEQFRNDAYNELIVEKAKIQ